MTRAERANRPTSRYSAMEKKAAAVMAANQSDTGTRYCAGCGAVLVPRPYELKRPTDFKNRPFCGRGCPGLADGIPRTRERGNSYTRGEKRAAAVMKAAQPLNDAACLGHQPGAVQSRLDETWIHGGQYCTCADCTTRRRWYATEKLPQVRISTGGFAFRDAATRRIQTAEDLRKLEARG